MSTVLLFLGGTVTGVLVAVAASFLILYRALYGTWSRHR